MKERPILFSGPMVRAILEGRKTQTRRLIKLPKPLEPDDMEFIRMQDGYPEGVRAVFESWDDCCSFKLPYGQTGDRLWVKETFFEISRADRSRPIFAAVDRDFIYRANYDYRKDSNSVIGGENWKPSIFMPRRASRINLQITGIRVERLQDISEEDAKAEGVQIPFVNFPQPADSKFKVGDPLGSYKDHYKCLWGIINGPDSWAQNPWVWVIEFPKHASN